MTTMQTLQDILVRDYHVAPEQVTAAATLTTLGLDSLSIIELMFKIEDAFGLSITDDTPSNLQTVGEVVAWIDELVASKAPLRPTA